MLHVPCALPQCHACGTAEVLSTQAYIPLRHPRGTASRHRFLRQPHYTTIKLRGPVLLLASRLPQKEINYNTPSHSLICSYIYFVHQHAAAGSSSSRQNSTLVSSSAQPQPPRNGNAVSYSFLQRYYPFVQAGVGSPLSRPAQNPDPLTQQRNG